ncbi:hypothetical protein VPH35_085876 [Triticum aestivum]
MGMELRWEKSWLENMGLEMYWAYLAVDRLYLPRKKEVRLYVHRPDTVIFRQLVQSFFQKKNKNILGRRPVVSPSASAPANLPTDTRSRASSPAKPSLRRPRRSTPPETAAASPAAALSSHRAFIGYQLYSL